MATRRSAYTGLIEDAPGYDTSDVNQGRQWVPLNLRTSLSIPHIIAICCSMLGFQIAYSAEFSLGTPIMKNFDISQVASSLIWSIGPIAGFFVQPLVGFYSDSLTSKLGRRRPFIIGGSLGIALGFGIFLVIDPLGDVFKDHKRTAKIVLVILAMLVTNCSINIMQGPARAIVGDVIPASQQVLANTIGSWMIGLAAVVTNLIGGFDLGKSKPLGIDTNHLVFIVGIILIAIAITITCIAAKEEPLLDAPRRGNPFRELGVAIITIPRPVLRMAIVYLLSWMAYMPFQFETTDFFGSTVFPPDKYDDGVHFGMIVIAVSNGLVLLYSFVQTRIAESLGLRLSYAISQIIEAAMLIGVLFARHYKWLLMALFAPLGISSTIFNSVPFAVVAMLVPKEQMGLYMGALNVFAVVGQQLATFLLGSGVAAFFDENDDWQKAAVISSGAVFAIAAAIASYWIPDPQRRAHAALLEGDIESVSVK
jgi:solute carrier family 45 protein 1/2/4